MRILPPGSSRARPLWKHGGVYFSEVFGDDPVGAPLDWSRDGRRLVAASSKGLVSVTRHGRGVFLTASRLDQSPRWSPDGSTVAFLREPACYVQPTCRQLAGVLLVSASRGGLRSVAAIPKALDLEWYPDGRSLLVGTNDFSGDESARTIHRVAVVDGKDQTLAADARLRDWSPRRTKILFERRGNLWVMDSDGGKQTLLPARPQGVIVGADW